MSFLSKAEVQYLQGNKKVSKSYEYKIKSILKKKMSILLDKEIPLLSTLFPEVDLTKFSKNPFYKQISDNLTENSKTMKSDNNTNNTNNSLKLEDSTSSSHNKLYNCDQDIHQHSRVRSVVRISRRSSEPQVMGSKPTGPVN